MANVPVSEPLHGKFYKTTIGGSSWELPERYENVQKLGSGTFGDVGSAYDKVLHRRVAIKKLVYPFNTEIHAKRTYRELMLLRHMKHEKIIGLLDVFSPNQLHDFEEIYFVTHLMETDLNVVLGSMAMKDRRLPEVNIQFIFYQILQSLQYMHSAGIIHRDLKPGNIAINGDCHLRVLDFGLARHVQTEMTGYVVTRWYRPPEVIGHWGRYTQAVDIWSVGCIFAEMLLGRVLFPGDDQTRQFHLILDMIGTPSAEFVNKVECIDSKNYILSLPEKPPKEFRLIFPQAGDLAVDLLRKMLNWDPNDRITAEQAMAHPYFEEQNRDTMLTTADPYDGAFEDLNISVEEWKALIFAEMTDFLIKRDS